MFTLLATAAVLLAGMWACGWMGGYFNSDLVVLFHMIYFAVLAVYTLPSGKGDGKRELPFWMMGIFSVLIFWQPWLGMSLMLFSLTVTGLGEWFMWWTTPKPGWSSYEDPEVGTCLEENLSPREVHRRNKLARQR